MQVSTHLWTQNQLGRPMKVPIEVVPKQTVIDEIAGRPVVDELVVPVAPDFVSEYLSKTETIIVL